MMKVMKHAYHLIILLMIAVLVGLALQPGNKGLAVRIFGIEMAISNLKCNTLTEGNVRKWERDTNTCSQKTE